MPDYLIFSLPLRRQLLSRSSFQGGMLPHEERQTIIFQQYTRPFFIPNVPYPTCGGSKAWSKQITLLLATGGQPSTTSRFCIRVNLGPWAFRCLKTPGVVKLHFFFLLVIDCVLRLLSSCICPTVYGFAFYLKGRELNFSADWHICRSKIIAI